MLNTELLNRTYDDLFEMQLKKSLVNDDSAIIRQLFRFLRAFYVRYPSEFITGKFAVLASNVTIDEFGLDINSAINCTVSTIHECIKFPAFVQLMSNDQVFLWNQCEVSITDRLAPTEILYEFSNFETVYVGKNEHRTPLSPTSSRTIFSIPTFAEVESAIHRYHNEFAKKSVCKLIKNAWENESKLRWKAGPESNLRDSLFQFLKASIHSAKDILPEQNVSEENPVDIKITWRESYARALIEIKWLGVSVDENSNITANYSNGRAVKGAEQLVDYIKVSKEQSYDCNFVGYLVVFDGRRRMVDSDDKLSRHTPEDSWHYEMQDLSDIPDSFKQNNCKYYRLFIEPSETLRKFSKS